MRALRLPIFVLALTIVGTPVSGQIRVVSQSPAVQILTDTFLIHSERIGRDFIVEVAIPDSVQPGRKYPAIYALDGGFGIVGPATRMMKERMSATFVVSVGYPDQRGRHVGPPDTDFLHARLEMNGQAVGGGGAAFEDVLLKDLRPFMEGRYPLDPEKAVLMGHSGGGGFAATVLTTKPEAFAGYVIIVREGMTLVLGGG
jgi:hypothetical protein